MKRYLVRHSACSWGDPAAGQCVLERIMEGQAIVSESPLRKCAHHASIPDGALAGVLREEATERKRARLAAPDGKVLLMRYEGDGPARRLVTQLLDRADG